MYTLKGVFPEPKKEQKRNFIKENMKQLKLIQNKSPKEPKLTLKSAQPSRLTTPITANALGQVKSSPSSKSGKGTLNVGKSSLSNRKKFSDVRIKKGDMAEFLRRKEMILTKQPEESSGDEVQSSESSSRLRDIGCQTIESNLAQRLNESTKLTMLYPMKESDDNEAKMKASGDSRSQRSPPRALSPRRAGDDMMEEKHRSRLNAILDRKDKDPYLPPGYQKGVLPKYLRDRKDSTKEVEDTKADDDNTMCPPGHVTLPDNERKETLRMLRNSFAELVSELNKMPVKTDTLRMRNRKMELEKQLAKLEEGIKVFSRPKVFVKIGE
ncbi:enkurin domain-containing protein 1-like [Nymphalis io]|uniref:enkurin domain-containing protein 1-like n=1 Tax=Inachis io TaxID=171585 RepID=UPI002167FF5E|nr:enkurin domain-containing protein 1-like [Nymphalis io]